MERNPANRFAMVKSIKPIPFTGKEADWHTWVFQFRNQVSLAGLAHMLLDARIVRPSFALVKLFTCLADSMPLEWQTKFSTLPTIQVEEIKEMKVPIDEKKPNELHSVPVPEKDRMSYFPIAHPSLCFLEPKRHYEREDEITVNALWAQLERCKIGNLTFDQFFEQLTILFSRLAAAGC